MTVLDQTASYSRLLCSPQTHKFAHKLVLVCKCTQVPTYAPITLALHAQTCSTMHSTTLTTNTLTACYMNICCAAAAVSLWGMCVLWSRSAHIRPCFSGLFLKAFLGTVCACAVDINEQPWGLHEHPTVQYKQHLSRDHSELWAKFSIEMPWL